MSSTMRYLPGVVTLTLDADACTGCGRCVEVCPHAVFVAEKRSVRIDERDACMECGACALNCPEDALSVEGGAGCAWLLLKAALLGRKTAEVRCCG